MGYEWTLETDLDKSFEFLLRRPATTELDKIPDGSFFLFIAGLFDAEGTIHLHNKRGRHNPEAIVTNSDSALVELVADRLRKVGYFAKVQWSKQPIHRGGIHGVSTIGRVILWRFLEVQRLKIKDGNHAFGAAVIDWYSLLDSIRKSRDEFASVAERILELRRIGDENEASELRRSQIEVLWYRGTQNELSGQIPLATDLATNRSQGCLRHARSSKRAAAPSGSSGSASRF